MWVVLPKLALQPGKAAEFDAATNRGVACTRAEPGAQDYRVFKKGDEYQFVEIFADKAALDKHLATPWFAEWRQAREACTDPASPRARKGTLRNPEDLERWKAKAESFKGVLVRDPSEEEVTKLRVQIDDGTEVEVVEDKEEASTQLNPPSERKAAEMAELEGRYKVPGAWDAAQAPS